MNYEDQYKLPSEFDATGSFMPNQPIFGPNFPVESMEQPAKYLPKYGQGSNQVPVHEPSCVQSCNSCCGMCCIFFAYPCALLGCRCGCAYELGTSKAGIVEEFGKFSRLINPGLSMINPCTEEVKEIDMRLRILNPGVIQCITKDNVKVSISSSIAYRIVNPVQVCYTLGDQINRALSESTHSGVRIVIGQVNLEEALRNRSKIVENSRVLIAQNLPQGVTIDNLFLEDIAIPPQTLQDLSAAARQRRLGEASIINSKADVESASLLKEAAQLLDTKAAMQIRYLEMIQQVGRRGAKLLMPIGVNKTGSGK